MNKLWSWGFKPCLPHSFSIPLCLSHCSLWVHEVEIHHPWPPQMFYSNFVEELFRLQQENRSLLKCEALNDKQRRPGSLAGHSCSCVARLEVVYSMNFRERTGRAWLKVRMSPSTPAVMTEHPTTRHIPSRLFARRLKQIQNNCERQPAKLGSDRGDKNLSDTISGYRWVSWDSSLCG